MNRLLLAILAVVAAIVPWPQDEPAAQGARPMPGATHRGVVDDRSGAQVAAGVSDSIASRMIKLSLSIERTQGRLSRLAYQPDRILLQQFDNGHLIVWDFERSAQVADFSLEAGAEPVAYDKAAARLLLLKDGALLALRLNEKGEPVREALLPNAMVSAAAWAGPRSLLLGFGDGSVARMEGGKAPARMRKAFDGTVMQLIAEPGGRRFAALSAGREARLFDERDQPQASVKGVLRLGSFGKGGVLAGVQQTGQVFTVSPAGAVTQHALPGKARAVTISPAGNSLLAVLDNGDLSTGWGGQWQVLDQQVREAAFVAEKRYIVARDDGVVHLKEAGLAHYLVAIVPASSGWVIVDHEGRYDGTVDGTKDVKWSGAGSKLDLDQFFQTYYQPGLLAAYISGQDGRVLQPVPANTGQGVFPPAKLDLEFPDGKMKAGQPMKVVAIAESMGGELPEDIRLFHNGKRLPDKARIGSQRVQQNEKILLVQVFSFTPEGGVNEVFAEVRNAHGVGSRSAVRHETTDGFRSPGRLYLLGTGIDKYRNPDINLDFAAGDVRAIVGNLVAGSAATHQESVPKLVLDARATRREILTQLAQLETLNTEDSVVLIFAGHGFAQDGEWYFLPHDADPQRLSTTAISAKEIQDALVNAPPKRIFMMVDACNSGAGIDSFNRFRAFQRRFVQYIGRNAGVTVLTATRRDQQAAELPELGHGVFTHTILQGLHGRAVSKEGGGRISAHQLANYVGENLEKVARPYLSGEGLNQTPAHFVIGADFVLGEVVPAR